MPDNFVEDLPELLDTVNASMIDLRHDLHAHPELAFGEFRTTQVIKDRLASLDFEIRACPTETGAVARIVGGRPGRKVMIRADIDGLPVNEERDLSYTSVIDGVMHACGHDVHTASLLGVAEILSRRRDELAGEFTLLFQPAEEVIGGAIAMIDGGVLIDNPVDYVIGAHVTSLAPVGIVALRSGIMMSDGQTLSVDISGRGGHGAMSTIEGNVVLAVSEIAPRLSEVAEGLVFEGTACACSAGVIAAGTANNVVPRRALLRGTLRTFTPDQKQEALARLRALLDDVERTFTVTCELQLDVGTPAVVNNADVTAVVRSSAARVIGTEGVLDFPPVTPSDDVSEFLRRVPGCYLFVGGALADGSSGMHHSPDFAIDDGACRVQAGVLAMGAVDLAAQADL
ncbi:MAG TPA: M20 family metallopeptidase [Acidimicrobiales bacterium]|jgi:amidohydrolase|nr:M20 family metallopeptidase [Acidimicrobiales bacterium]